MPGAGTAVELYFPLRDGQDHHQPQPPVQAMAPSAAGAIRAPKLSNMEK